MKKTLILIAFAICLLSVTKSASAAECRVVKIERPGFAYSKVVCINPTQPVNITTTATSTDGRAVARSFVYIRSTGGSVNVTSTVIATSSSSTN